MDLASLYNEAYAGLENRATAQFLEEVERDSQRMFFWVRENKDKFLAGIDWKSVRILECGGGTGGVSLHLASLGAKCTLVDFSTSALEFAKSFAVQKGVELETHCLNLAWPIEEKLKPFDIIIDSHLLHCLALTPDRLSFYQFLKDHLKPSGIVVGETMAFRKKIYIPEGWRLDDKNILWQKFADWVAVRRIADSIDLEQEFKSSGLNIECFLYYANYGIAPSSEHWDIPADVLPAAVRYVLKKA